MPNCLSDCDRTVPVGRKEEDVGSCIVFERLVLLGGEEHGEILVPPVKGNLHENLVLAKLSIIGDVIEDHEHGSRVIIFSVGVSRDDVLLDVVYLINLVHVVLGRYVANGNVLGELFDDILSWSLYES